MEMIGNWLSNPALLVLVVVFIIFPIGGLTLAFMVYRSEKRSHYWHKQNLPTLAEYIQQNPGAKTSRGIRCVHCNTGVILNRGLDDASDRRRVFRCHHCNTLLSRNEDWK